MAQWTQITGGKWLKRCASPGCWRPADVFYYKRKQCCILQVRHIRPNSGWQWCLSMCQKIWNWRRNNWQGFFAFISSSNSVFPQRNVRQGLGPGPWSKLGSAVKSAQLTETCSWAVVPQAVTCCQWWEISPCRWWPNLPGCV